MEFSTKFVPLSLSVFPKAIFTTQILAECMSQLCCVFKTSTLALSVLAYGPARL